MNFYNCLRMIQVAVEKEILVQDPNNPDNILVARADGEDSFYSSSENAFHVANELMLAPDGQEVIKKALLEKGVIFEEKPLPFNYFNRKE